MNRPPLLAAWQARWHRLPAREQGLVQLAAALVLAALLWQALAPAVATLRGAEAQARTLDTQLQQMRAMQGQAQALHNQPSLGQDEAQQALERATRETLGASARLTTAGGRVTVTLTNVPADALAQWLALARINARSTPLEARLLRTNSSGTATWNGVLVMGLPQ